MAVFYTAPFVADELTAAFEQLGVPFDWLRDAASNP
jgi:hypothetical protein